MIKNFEKTTINLYDLMDKIDDGISIENFLIEVERFSKIDLISSLIIENEPDLLPFIELMFHHIEVQKHAW